MVSLSLEAAQPATLATINRDQVPEVVDDHGRPIDVRLDLLLRKARRPLGVIGDRGERAVGELHHDGECLRGSEA